MSTNRVGFRPALDGVRAVAIVGVLFAHGFPGVLGDGGEGVTVFFVLSGYLITTLLMDESANSGTIRLPEFYIRRAGRLFPAFALVLATTTLLELSVGAAPTRAIAISVVAASYVSNLFLGSYGQRDLGGVAIIGWTWTLSIEEQFYLAWPLLLRRLLRTRHPIGTVAGVAGVLALLSTAWYLTLVLQGGHGLRASLGTDTRAGALLVGCALAAFARSGRRVPTWTSIPALAVLVFVFLFPASIWPDVRIVNVLAVPSAAAFLVAAAGQESRDPLRAALSARPVTYLGRISYGVYLWNSLLQWIFIAVGVSPRGLMVLVWVPLTIAVAAASARWVERPPRDWSRRYAQRRRMGKWSTGRVDPGVQPLMSEQGVA